MPKTIGRNSAVSTGSVRVAAPRMRRITTPHAPPETWCTIASASEPSVTPSSNKYAARYERTNCAGFRHEAEQADEQPAAAGDRTACVADPAVGQQLVGGRPSVVTAGFLRCVGRQVGRPWRSGSAAARECRRRWPSDRATRIWRRSRASRRSRCVITSKKCPGGALAQPVDVKRRRTAVSALHDHAVAVAGRGRGKASSRCRSAPRPRCITVSSIGNGNTVASCAVRLCRCTSSSSSRRCPRAIVPSTGGRADRPSAKNDRLRSSGLYFG